MLNKVLIAVTSLVLVFSVSCGSKKKTEEAADATAVAASGPDDSIASKDMSFDPEGSDGGKIAGLSTVNFEYDQATLTSTARQLLNENAEWVKKNGDVVVQIEGHCDSRGSVEYNLALGERRAKAVKNYLVSLGVNAKKLTIISYGKEKLLAMGESEDDHAKNRRANFVPLPK